MKPLRFTKNAIRTFLDSPKDFIHAVKKNIHYRLFFAKHAERMQKISSNLKNYEVVFHQGERFDPIAGDDKVHSARYLLAQKKIRNLETVLDIACGTGYGSRMLAEVNKHVTGVDIAPIAIDYAKEHYASPNLNFFVCSLFDWHEKCDAVCSFETVEHIPAKAFTDVILHIQSLAKKTVLMSCPYNEPSGVNEHHVWSNLNEKSFDCLHAFGRVRFYYQKYYGGIDRWKRRNVTYQNLIVVLKK